MNLGTAHLTYCTNIHAGETWPDTFSALQFNFPVIKAQLSPDKPMGIGLRLSNIGSIDLLNDEIYFQEFQQWLTAHNAYVFTMNGFPYGNFHHAHVKDQVHAPDWTTNDRLTYTLRLFDILAKLLPEGMEGGISTSPLSYKPWHTASDERKKVKEMATANILKVAAALYRMFESTGVILHLDIEPEPDGFLESGEGFINWFENDLLAIGVPVLSEQLNLTAEETTTAIKQHIRLCYDVCHFAIGYEPHAEVIDQLAEKGIKVGKIQISAALKAALPSSPDDREPIVHALSKFTEATYLHQVIAKTNSGSLIRYPDLPEALADNRNPGVIEWRAHFHVPIFAEDMGLVKSTQADIVEVLNKFKENPFTQHLEVETYTWEVLPEDLKVPLTQSITRELDWVIKRLV
ncbi:metabolite traffic protein EboE [Pedobacter sp. L105]|uniref:metabolite traffic protein EboE n=1 Tax=Pedobacter sp. L105 TaxID=1641871 RepID=UPI00131B9221|nr:metabolite traffic protein EboE [Pedobacter sp. L105]